MFKIKFNLKRKISGKAIRERERMKKFDPENHVSNRYLEWYHDFRDKRPKRHIENPNLYVGEVFQGGGTLRKPRKCRKTAWKRFEKIQNQRLSRRDYKYISPEAEKILNKK